MASALRKPATVQRKPMGTARTSTGKAALTPTQHAKALYEKGRKLVDELPRKRKNPLAAAAELSRAFHGREPERVIESVKRMKVHSTLAELGSMELLVIQSGEYEVPVKFKHSVKLASNEQGNQYFFDGGDQTVDLSAFPTAADDGREFEFLGYASRIVYFTEKQHLGKEDKIPGPYEHELGEEGGELPVVVYDVRNRELLLAGGSYHIDVDMDGEFSAGVRN